MNETSVRTLGVVVAGGPGLRLAAGVPKADVRLGATTLRDRAVATLVAVCDVVVIAAPIHRAPPDAVAEAAARDADTEHARRDRRSVAARVRWVPDAPGGEGPLAGVVGGLAAERFQRAVVLGADFPFVTAPLFRALLDQLERHDAPAVVPAPRGIQQPLVAAYAPEAACALERAFARGERSIVRAVQALDALVLDPAQLAALPGGIDAFFNLNTPEDLAVAARRVAGES
jgi:molybdopterin-guanine dinucleotide biosynthesis protein A